MTINEQLAHWIREQNGSRLGQVALWELRDDETFRLCHTDDEAIGREKAQEHGLTIYQQSIDAIEISKFNAAGDYRPLKTSPDLKNGWLLEVTGIDELRLALDYLYPAMVGTWFAHRAGAGAISLRSNLNRQTGMYRYARTIEDADAIQLVGCTCDSASHCLKRVIWDLDGAGTEIHSLPESERTSNPHVPGEMPLLCLEPCSLLISAARTTAKEAFARKNPDT